MQTNEARVAIVDDSLSKQERLREVITHTGGSVVFTADTVEEAKDAVSSPNFSASMGNPNVVLLDQQLPLRRGYSERSGSGSQIFEEGDRSGNLRRADEPGIGVVAFGISGDPYANVVGMTGTYFSPDDPERDRVKWGILLNPHPVTPEFAPQGSIERVRWEHLSVAQMLNVFQREGRLGEAVTLYSLQTQESSGKEQQPVENVPTGGSVQVSGQSESLASLLHGGVGIRQAVVTTPTDLLVVTNSVLPNPFASSGFGPERIRRGRLDQIPLDRVHDLPQSYWRANGFNPASLRS